MKGKYISFAQVLKRKQPKTLLEMFEEWQQNPRNSYTLHLNHSNTNRSSQYFSNMISSKNDQQGIMFDSWIEGLGSQNNQLNIMIDHSHEKKQVRKENGPKKIILSSRGKQNKNVTQQRKPNVLQQKSPNNIRSPAPQIEMIHSKEFKNERNAQEQRKSPSSFKNRQVHNQDNTYYNSKTQRSINSFHIQKESVGNNLPSARNKKNQQKQAGFGQAAEKDEAKGELQKIINATDNIHVQIAEIAHHFVLQQKKRKQLQEQELLLSLQEQKRISLKSQNKQKINVLPPIPENDNRQDIQKKLREEVKKQVGNFLKTSLSKAPVPSFGSKINPTATTKINNETFNATQNNPIQDSLTEDRIVGNVGFSFSTCLQKQNEKKHNQIPFLEIPETPSIPEIPQIKSQRNHSESNEEIYDFYQQWKQKENIYYEKHENAPHIQSVVYHNQNDSPYLNTLSKQQKEQQAIGTDIVHNTFGKHQRQDKQVEFNSNRRSVKSEEKPQILVTIPSNYKEIPSEIAENKEIQLHIKDYQSNIKTEILCLSASPQPLQIPEKQAQYYPNLKQFQSNRQIELQVQENHFTQQKEKQCIEDKLQALKNSIKISLNASPKTNLTNNQQYNKKPVEKASQKVQKTSPNQQSNSCKLNKVYSSPKQTVIEHPKIASTSQFSATQDHKKEEYKIPIVTLKYNGGKFNFGYNKQNTQQKTIVQEKAQKQQCKALITQKQQKMEERIVLNKIQSYAYMKNNIAPSAALKNSIKQQEKDEFQFDF